MTAIDLKTREPGRSTLANRKAELKLLFLAYGTAICDGRRRDAHRYRAEFFDLLNEATK